MSPYEALLTSGTYRLHNEFSPSRQKHPLHFNRSAYNWLTLYVDHPPAYDSDNNLTPQTKYETIRFGNPAGRDIALLLANGNSHCLWWAAIGDDFHTNACQHRQRPRRPGNLKTKHRQSLLTLLPELKNALDANLVFKRNAGKNIGNYNLAKYRHVTDKADMIRLQTASLSNLWEGIYLEHYPIVRTSFAD